MVLAELFEGLIAWTFALIQAYGPYSVFFAVILEEVLIPIPSPLVIMGAAFILIPADLAFWDAVREIFFVIVIPASIASTIGSFFTYGIGYYGGRPLITKFQKFLGISWLQIEKTEKRFEKGKKVWTTIAILRAIPFFPIALVSLTSGVLRLSWKKYAVATFLGSIPRTFVLGIIGWEVGSTYVALASRLNQIENILVVVVLAAIVYVLYRYRHKYKHHLNIYRNVGSSKKKKRR